MTGREYVLNKLNDTNKKANSIDCYFVLTFWYSPFETLECEVAYFGEGIRCDSYFESMISNRKNYETMPWCIYTSSSCEYDTEFVKMIDNDLSDKNVTMLNWLK